MFILGMEVETFQLPTKEYYNDQQVYTDDSAAKCHVFIPFI